MVGRNVFPHFFSDNRAEIAKFSIKVVIFIIVIAFIFGLIFYGASHANKSSTKYSPIYVQTCVTTLKYDNAKLALVNEVDKYIKSVAPQTALDGYVITEECLNSSIDI